MDNEQWAWIGAVGLLVAVGGLTWAMSANAGGMRLPGDGPV